jgi:opacity protein-like surface antigen
MKTVILAAVALASIAASLPAAALAQAAQPPASPSPAAPNGISAQLDRLSSRVDRYLAQGQLSQKDAHQAHLEINRIQDEASADREQHGGHLTVADHFDLQAEIDHLNAELHRERTGAAGTPVQ